MIDTYVTTLAHGVDRGGVARLHVGAAAWAAPQGTSMPAAVSADAACARSGALAFAPIGKDTHVAYPHPMAPPGL